MLLTRLANIILILQFGRKNPILLGLPQKLTKPRTVLPQPPILSLNPIHPPNLFPQLLDLAFPNLALSLSLLDLCLIILDLSLEELFVQFLGLDGMGYGFEGFLGVG